MKFRLIHRLLCEERGATAIEYGLIASLIAIAAISGISALGVNIGTLYDNLAANMK